MQASSSPNVRDRLGVADWRRRIGSLYAQVRAEPDTAAGHELWRAGRDQLFASHPASPLDAEARSAFSGLPVAPYDGGLRFAVPLRSAGPAVFEAETGTDGTVRFERAGAVRLPEIGQLDVWWLAGYGGGLFVPVRDALAGRTTFGGGRYLLDTVKGADLGTDAGLLVLDLNFAYNPSCAYDEAWACPLAPQGNVVDAELPVGELMGTLQTI
jgi:uncharacterized protein (DUF1684 family)